ncbi:MAG: hypothetical protein JW940_38795 [Polyangiaceae bacterium]|nr:hypothetical protein [Polyangiaceae bacterium]
MDTERSTRRACSWVDLTLVAAVTACAASPRLDASPVPRPAAAPAARPATTTPSTPPNASAPAWRRTEPTVPAACVLEGDPWLADDDQAVLRLRPGGTPFVHVGVNAARVQVPVSEQVGSVFVELSCIGWHVAGHLDAAAFSVRPVRLLTFYGFMVPTEFASLTVTQARPDELMLSATVPAPVRLAGPMPPEPAACRDVGIAPPQPLDAASVLVGHTRAQQRSYLEKRGIPLRVQPDSEPIAWLDPTGGRQDVLVLEQRGASTRIVVTGHTTLVFGWVPTRDVVTPRPRVAEGHGSGGFAMGAAGQLQDGPTTSAARRSSDRTAYQCSAPVPLVVDARGELMQVGSIDPGIPLEAVERAGGLVHLVPPRGIGLVDGASVGIPEAELARCERVP